MGMQFLATRVPFEYQTDPLHSQLLLNVETEDTLGKYLVHGGRVGKRSSEQRG